MPNYLMPNQLLSIWVKISPTKMKGAKPLITPKKNGRQGVYMNDKRETSSS
jgi:hypothetical protein